MLEEVLKESQTLPIQMLLLQHMYNSSHTRDTQQSQDIINCGKCRKTFTLDNAALFLQHKLLSCDDKTERNDNNVKSINQTIQVENAISSSSSGGETKKLLLKLGK